MEERSFFRPFPCFGPSPARCRNLFPAFRIAGRCGCPACASSSRLPPKAFRSGPPSYAFCRMSLLPGAVLHKKKAIRKIPHRMTPRPFAGDAPLLRSPLLCHSVMRQREGGKRRRFSNVPGKICLSQKKTPLRGPAGHTRRSDACGGLPAAKKAGSSKNLPKRPAPELQTLTTIMRGATLPSGTGI